jgi:hypothetical protein
VVASEPTATAAAQRELFFGEFILGVARRPDPLGQQTGGRTCGAVHGAASAGVAGQQHMGVKGLGACV